MSRTNIGADTLARMLRRMAGDGSVEWIHEPIQSSVLLDIADMLDENAKMRDERERLFRANVERNGEILRLLEENAELRELVRDIYVQFDSTIDWTDIERRMRELGIEVPE